MVYQIQKTIKITTCYALDIFFLEKTLNNLKLKLVLKNYEGYFSQKVMIFSSTRWNSRAVRAERGLKHRDISSCKTQNPTSLPFSLSSTLIPLLVLSHTIYFLSLPLFKILLLCSFFTIHTLFILRRFNSTTHSGIHWIQPSLIMWATAVALLFHR